MLHLVVPSQLKGLVLNGYVPRQTLQIEFSGQRIVCDMNKMVFSGSMAIREGEFLGFMFAWKQLSNSTTKGGDQAAMTLAQHSITLRWAVSCAVLIVVSRTSW